MPLVRVKRATVAMRKHGISVGTVCEVMTIDETRKHKMIYVVSVSNRFRPCRYTHFQCGPFMKSNFTDIIKCTHLAFPECVCFPREFRFTLPGVR